MAFDIGSVVAKIDADISGFKKGMQEAENSVNTFTKKIDNFSTNLKNVGQKLTLVSAVVGGGLSVFLKSASEEAINFERAMTTLDIISGRFGVSAEEAKKSAQDLGKELRIGIGPAANSLQNLLKSGLNLDQANELMKRFINEAITGKSPTISLAQAVENLSFAYATNNSALGNLSGISENFANIIENGKEALIKEGVAADTITEQMAKYRGMMDLTNLTLGSSERFTGTLIDKQAILDQKIQELKVSFGELVNPYITQLVEKLTQLVEWFNSLTEEQKKTILIIMAVVAAIGPLLLILGTLVSGVSAVISIIHAVGIAMMFLIANPIALLVLAIIGLYLAWKNNFMGIQDQVKALWELINIKFNEGVNFLKSIGGRIKDAIVSPFEDAWNKVKDIMNKIKDALDFTKRHSPSVMDIVNNSIRLVNRAFSELEPALNIAPHVMNSTTNPINNISISLAGAVIADEYSAERMGEIMGDSIIKKLQLNVRF